MTDFTIAVLDGSLAASVSATLDVLAFANRIAAGLGRPPLRWRVVGQGRQVRLSNGLRLPCEPLPADPGPDGGILVIPGLGLDDEGVGDDHTDGDRMDGPLVDGDRDRPATRSGLDARYAERTVLQRLACRDARRWAAMARTHHQRGGRVAASCSGVLVLGEAGLLDSRRATTHWALAALLHRRYPLARLDPACMVVEDGRIVTAGAALAQLDLMLHLLRWRAGRDVAEAVMRHLLIDSRTTQARYMAWQALGDAEDETLRRFEALVEASLPGGISMAEAARRLHLTPKTLARRIARATGGPPRQLVQAIRMRQAQRLLDSTELSIEEIATRVGYAEATSLRKLTLKMTRLTPAQLRPHAR